ncbi:hypothetical protein BV20DRAFT_977515 [Pilatotrama ljubarskyi]|nr:hypothetical protein BV20DRAFT_977515 [Pilatotrama ljubarskyi]
MANKRPGITLLILGYVWTLLLIATPSVLGGNTTCASDQLDWYTSVVGESPCMTYQRLRQICNNDYQVPDFRPHAPGDNCDDQISTCCCNTVAFQLSMLCMNCQQDKVAGNQINVNAGVGTYALYRASCGAGTNRSLPTDIQAAVCNENIKLDDILYDPGWDDGEWFYVFTKESAERNHAAHNNNTFSHCPDQISPSASAPSTHPQDPSETSSSSLTTSSISPDTTPGAASAVPGSSGQRKSSSSNVVPIVAAVVGAIAGLAALLGLFILWRRRRSRSERAPMRGIQDLPHFSYNYDDSGQLEATSMYESGPRLNPAADIRAGDRNFSSPAGTSPRDPPSHLTWSEHSSATPHSTLPSNATVRHADAGVMNPLARSASGRLPPAYRSWEEASRTGSDIQTTAPQTSPPSVVSEVVVDAPTPLVTLVEKDTM